MPRMKTESLGGSDMSWLASEHGLSNARTELLDISTFTPATHYPDGYIKSGTPLAKVGGVLVPYTVLEATTTGAGILEGFLLTDQAVVPPTVNTGKDFAVPLLDHGRVKASKVPYASFVAPIDAAKNVRHNVVFV